MSKMNPLAGLIANYGDSEDESDDDTRVRTGPSNTNNRNHNGGVTTAQNYGNTSAAIHPAPIPHCPWSACYDESSGFTYYWNQQTNAVTWEAPPEYLLALKLAQQQLSTSGSGEVSAEEWQLYQQALAEKQTSQSKVIAKPALKSTKKNDRNSIGNKDKNSKSKKRTHSEDDEEKIELITSYHNSDSESNDESESPAKPAPATAPVIPKVQPKPNNVYKKPKLKTQEYGPSLPPNLNYSAPIGPELPPEMTNNVATPPSNKIVNAVKEEKSIKNDEDSQDETTLLKKLKDKAKLLEKLGGEIPRDLQKMINEESGSGCATPKTDDSSKTNVNIDELLEEIEKKELPKVTKSRSNTSSAKNSPINSRDGTPPAEPKPLFPSIQNIDDTPVIPIESDDKKVELVAEKKGANLYLSDSSERIDVGKKKLRISNSVLPKKEPVYTTKYSQFIEGFSNERVGLGFSKEEERPESPKNAISYGNGLMFTKGETLNEEKKDDDLDDLTDLLEMKLKYLNQLQPCVLTPVQEMLIQMQTLVGAFRAGALGAQYWRRWAGGAARQLAAHERHAAPPGWTAAFQRSEGRYCYRRESDGLIQWEYPATAHTDMDISTTPPHPGIEAKEEVQPVLAPSPPAGAVVSPRSPRTPPPPAWHDPPPPGCDDLPPLPATHEPPKQEIGDELASFYSDIAELEKVQPIPDTTSVSPEPVEREEKKERSRERERERERERIKEKEKEKDRDKDGKVSKKKSKVKISSSIGLKHKSVSTLVAKWQQVAEEINSD